MSIGSIEVRTRGITQMKRFAAATQDIPIDAFPVIVEEMRKIGVAAGKASIKATTGNKKIPNTGDLYRSFKGIVHVVNKEHRRVEIGSDLDYAGATMVDTGPIEQNEFVQIHPWPKRRIDSNAPTRGLAEGGTWAFIGIRPRIAGHPFMEETKEKIEKDLNYTITRVLKKGWGKAVGKGQGAPSTP